MKLARWTSALTALASCLATQAAAQDVFAHVIVGNNGAYTIADWTSDIQLAAKYGIDAFVLNITPPLAGTTATQISYAFQAANNLINGGIGSFKLFLSFDYLGNGMPWPKADVISILNDYGPNGAYFLADGKPLVSTFEGPSNSDINEWAEIRSAVNGGIYFVPDWTSLGPNGFSPDLVDGTFSSDMWPIGPNDITTEADTAWSSLAGKSYMMGVSPWFYTNLPNYNKAWVWRGDDMWYRRWEQTRQVKPRFVEIVTWNDFGESHYIGPIVGASIPPGAETYVNGMPHTAWLQTLPYQIAAYKNSYDASNPAPVVATGEEKIVFWYRTSPASAGTTVATGNNCPSAININGYQPCYSPAEILEDEVFAIVFASSAGTVNIASGNAAAVPYQVQAGINFISQPFDGKTGVVKLSMGSDSSEGVAITAQPKPHLSSSLIRTQSSYLSQRGPTRRSSLFLRPRSRSSSPNHPNNMLQLHSLHLNSLHLPLRPLQSLPPMWQKRDSSCSTHVKPSENDQEVAILLKPVAIYAQRLDADCFAGQEQRQCFVGLEPDNAGAWLCG